MTLINMVFGVCCMIATSWMPAFAVEARAQSAPGQWERAQKPSDEEPPIKVSANYSSDLNSDLAGGERRGLAYLGKLSVIADADLETSTGLRDGVLHVSVLNIHGTGLSGHYVGNLAAVSGIEADPATRLNQLFIQGRIGNAVQARIGKFPAAQDFAVTDVGALFVNSTFGWPASFATDLPNGGPSWPLAAPGFMLSAPVNRKLTLSTAIFAGDPVGTVVGDPQKHDGHGFRAFGLHGRPLAIAEARISLGADNALKVGGWAHLGRFGVVRANSDPASQRGNWAIYGVIDWTFAHSGAEPRNWQAFVRATASPKDRNVVAVYADGGIVLNAPFKSRPKDAVGIALSYIVPSRDIMRDDRRAEWVFETSYKASITSKLYLQPNIQVIRPFSGQAGSTDEAIATALVIGLRTSLSL